MASTTDSSEEQIEPLTEAQLSLVDTWIKHAAQSAAARVSRRALIGFLILLGGLGGQYAVGQHDAGSARHATVQSGRAVATDGCNRDFYATDTLRGIIIRLKVANDQSFESAVAKTKDPVALKALQEQRDGAQKFYGDTLGDLHYPRCEKARSIVTDDPSKTIVVPRPLTVSDAKNADVAAASERIAKGG